MGYILFSSEETVSITTQKHWDGTIEYSYDNQEWKEWNGEEIINNLIYMRGINNTVVSDTVRWNINGENVKCQGNIENLLDYKYVINNVHPPMHKWCFAHLFANCLSLTEVSLLLPITIGDYVYTRMFINCKKLLTVPQLIISKLSTCSYERMFDGCKLLTSTVVFPNLATAKEDIINQQMFRNCPIQTVNINNKLYDINVLKLL